MIDWLTLLVPFNGPEISGGRVLQIDEDGSVVSEFLRFLPVEGSFSSSVRVCTESTGLLSISGNPAKFLQGHNLFGSEDLFKLSFEFVSKVLEKIGCLDLHTLSCVRRGHFWIKRIDLTNSYELNDISEVRAWLQAARVYASGKNQKLDHAGSTIYFGKLSKRMTIKAYCKGDEIKVHPLRPEHFTEEQLQILKEWAQNKLRIELTLRRKALTQIIIHECLNPEYLQLKKIHGDRLKPAVVKEYEEAASLFYAANWHHVKTQEVYTMKANKMQLPGNLQLSMEDIELLPNRYKAAYKIWREGGHYRNYCSERTFYRVKKYFMTEHGINIEILPNPQKCQVIPLIRPLLARPAEIPAWAYKHGLIAV